MNPSRPLPRHVADRRLWHIQPIRDFAGLCALAALLWLLFDFRQLLAPVVIAFIVAYVCDPMLQAVTARTGLPRWSLALVLTLILILGVVLFFTWVGPLLTEQIQALASKVPQYIATLEQRYSARFGKLSEHLAAVAEGIKESPVKTLSPLFTGTSQAVGILGAIVVSTVEILVAAMLLPIFFFLFAWHFDSYRQDLDTVLARRREPRLRRTIHRMDEAVSGFVRGRALIALITTVAFAIGWSWAGVPYALLLGIMTGLLTIVPYLAIAGWPVALLLKYVDMVSSGGAPAWSDVLIWPSAVFLLVGFLEGWVLTPWIQSKTMELSAVAVLLAVMIGGGAGGMLGLLLAIPVTACGKIIWEEYRPANRPAHVVHDRTLDRTS
ncbi:putative integral inner membrane protein [Nitrospira sp. KM1]|uniref:AI-2E family transporter n=1 Tax=Nitrospira sp. KM1 TaxID=1936990 RepID=UPI0013A7A840|nr:AI-2E family transporter [Nitrospira sp. KM1]BCA53829.1 putative integral inner membrane protein [Nitrospira sp. KM1]